MTTTEKNRILKGSVNALTFNQQNNTQVVQNAAAVCVPTTPTYKDSIENINAFSVVAKVGDFETTPDKNTVCHELCQDVSGDYARLSASSRLDIFKNLVLEATERTTSFIVKVFFGYH